MNPRAPSLRMRLLALILLPLLVIAAIAGVWRFRAAERTALDLFDRNLIALTLVVARDVQRSDGDAMSVRTRDALEDASNEQVFYHVAGPDRSLLIGYAYPPRPATPTVADGQPRLFSGRHKGEPIRAAQIIEPLTIDGIRGPVAVTVWQSTEGRSAFARRQALRTLAVLAAMIGTVVAVVWFGIRFGLRPLEDLQQAIALRRPDDLAPIGRAVPEETREIVATLNRLFAQLADSLSARDRFISDAAHQLRTPIAGIRALAESVETAPDVDAAMARARSIVAASAHASRLTEQLLRLERLRAALSHGPGRERLDLGVLAETAALEIAPRVLDAGIEFTFEEAATALPVEGDPVMLREALENLIHNALTHGGPAMSRITVSAMRSGQTALLCVQDDGKGIPVADRARIFERFHQIEGSTGSGLGLAIVAEIAARHGGSLTLTDGRVRGARFELRLPLAVSRLEA